MVNNFCKEDINQINELGAKLNPNFKELFHIDNLPETENILTIKNNNELIGFIHYSKIFECIEIQNIIIEKSYRNKGYASTLINILISKNIKTTQKIILEVNENNIEAIKFYQKQKFKEINRRHKYYKTGDAIIMERVL